MRPHREHERAIGRRLVLEPRDESREPRERRFGCRIGTAPLELDDGLFAGRLAALELHIDELGERRGAIVDARKSAAPEHRAFERQLRARRRSAPACRWAPARS